MTRHTLVLASAAALLASPAAWAADLVGNVKMAGAPAANVVVYVESVSGGPTNHPNALNQAKLRFDPPILPIIKGTKVIFPNTDPIFHSVYSAAGAAPFDLGLYMKGPGKTYTFNTPGYALVNCHIHKHMQAYVLVLNNGYFTTTDGAGRFALKGIPGSGFKVTAWASPTQTQTKPAAGPTLDFSL